MGAENITDKDLIDLDIEIVETKDDGDRTLKISVEKLLEYVELIKSKLTNGFWNEIVGEKEIIFIFKFKDGSTKEYELSPENEKEISALCSEFANIQKDKIVNIYKFISDNKFYGDFMMEHYTELINR